MSSTTSTTSTAQVYVPVHKRSASQAMAARVYTPSQLLALAQSPLAQMSHEKKEDLRARLPEIVLSRRQRKFIEHQTRQHQPQAQAGSKREASRSPSPSARTAPAPSDARATPFPMAFKPHNHQQPQAQRQLPRQRSTASKRSNNSGVSRPALTSDNWRTGHRVVGPLISVN
ncbi:hypothetical protein DL96DRAFT_1014705 [Flagelloscypha sp. PMI_526]|nr:hypothetical protein DL96DRAFT_1014705 [Flagelloscypha sp. PMI_526]